MLSEDLYSFICCLMFRSFFKFASSHKASPAPVDTNSLLAFTPHFLAHTASSMCLCQVTLLINKSVLAAVEELAVLLRPEAARIIWAARGVSPPPADPLASDTAASAT